MLFDFYVDAEEAVITDQSKACASALKRYGRAVPFW